MDKAARTLLTVLVALFAVGLAVSIFGAFHDPADIKSFVLLAIIMAGGLLVAMAPVLGLANITVGLQGIKATLNHVQNQVNEQQDQVKQQQKIINTVVKYSMAEIIYREILWKLANNREVKVDHTADQVRWLTFLFDHGFLQPRDASQWVRFDNLPLNHDLGEFFKPTPAAEDLIQTRGKPAGV